MKIIDIGICVNNKDPKGIGRIRAIRYNDYIGEKEKSVDYEEWGDKDPFICLPFLPPNINFIPLEKQSVKIINYDSDKETVNQEYISGPFTTNYDYNSQVFSQQIENTTYGIAIKHGNDVINPKNNTYTNPRSNNVYAKENDYGIYGKSGSDLIFTENGIVFRGGKLLSKESASVVDRKIMISQPLMSNNVAKLFLKKFPNQMELIPEIITETIYDSANLNYIVEYDVDNLTTPSIVNFYLYILDKNKSLGITYNSLNFNQFSPLNNDITKLITTQNSNVTFSIPITSIQDAYIEIRGTISMLHDLGIKQTIINLNLNKPEYSKYPSGDLHPFYFRPTHEFNSRTTTLIEKTNRNTIISNIEVCKVGFGSGLIWSQNEPKPKPKNKEIKNIYGKIKKNSPEQTFGAIVSDRIYFLSTDTNETEKPINFNDLNKYEYTQEDYIKKIEPNTYSIVRGENLILFLKGVIDLLLSHKHNLIGPLVTGDPNYDRLLKLISTVEYDILNNSIRIN